MAEGIKIVFMDFLTKNRELFLEHVFQGLPCQKKTWTFLNSFKDLQEKNTFF